MFGRTGTATELPLTRAFRNTGYLLGGKGVSAVLGFATTAVAANELGLATFGILLLVHSFAGAASVGTRLQSWQPLLQFGSALFHAQERPNFQTLLRHCLLLDLLGALAALAVGVPLAMFAGPWLGWGGHEHASMLYMSSALFMNTGAAIGVMRLADRFKMAAIADSAGALVRLAGALAGMALHWGLPGFLAVWYASTVTAFAVDMMVLGRLTRTTPSLLGLRFLNVPWRSGQPGFWKLVASTSGNQALVGLTSRMDILVLGAALGPADAALYRVAAQLGEAASQPAQLLAPALYPEFAKLRDMHEFGTLRRIIHRVFQGLAVLSVLALLLAGLAGPWLLDLMLGVHVPNVLPFLLIMTAAAIVDIWDVPLEPLLVSLGKAHLLFHGRFWIILLCLPLLYGAARLEGLNGVAIISLLRECGVFLTRLLPFLMIF